VRQSARPSVAIAIVATLGILTPSRAAKAEPAPAVPVEWGKLAAMFESPLDAHHTPAPPPARGDAADVVEPSPAAGWIAGWLGRAPRFSLVARDWSGSQRLLGELTLTDELRPTHSIRMAVSRVRLTGGAVVPFAQLGVGEWRVDPTLLPTLPHAHDVAALTGLGFEAALSPATSLALEMDWTFLRVGGDADVVAMTHPALWSTCLAARTRF
jgi:hypothetical protein